MVGWRAEEDVVVEVEAAAVAAAMAEAGSNNVCVVSRLPRASPHVYCSSNTI